MVFTLAASPPRIAAKNSFTSSMREPRMLLQSCYFLSQDGCAAAERGRPSESFNLGVSGTAVLRSNKFFGCENRSGSGGLLCLVGARNGARRDRQAIPHIDQRSQDRQVHNLLFAEVLLYGFVGFVWHVRLRYQGQRFRPLQCRSFALGVKRSLAPGIQFVETLLSLAESSCILGMHVDTIRASIDLRRAQFQQMDQLVIEAAGGNVLLQRIQ